VSVSEDCLPTNPRMFLLRNFSFFIKTGVGFPHRNLSSSHRGSRARCVMVLASETVSLASRETVTLSPSYVFKQACFRYRLW
jgi:hypothetical protein